MLTLKEITEMLGEDTIVITCLTERDLDRRTKEGGVKITSRQRDEILRRASDQISGMQELETILDKYSQT